MGIAEHIAVTHLTDPLQLDPSTGTIDALAGAALAATGVDLVHVAAAELVIEDNIRTTAGLDTCSSRL
jgi:ParB family transcriptional regulator, chromosome partitioning protein